MRIANSSRKFDNGVGFSNGCAELTLKKPPPFVPSCLIAICDAVGPAASQIAIKQLGRNGGGFFNGNSAHPFENPTPVSNFLELLAIRMIPAGSEERRG